MVSVFLVSDSPHRRASLHRAAEAADVRVVGESDDGGGGSGADVVLLDGEAALDAWEQAGEEDEWPAAVVVLADVEHGEAREAVEAFRALDVGGWAVLPRDATAAQLRAAIASAAAGLAVMPADWRDSHDVLGPAALHDNVSAAAHENDPDDDAGVVHEQLTPREADVLELMAQGLSNRQVGARLGISEHTAKFHVASVLGKLGAHNRAEAIRRGIRRGLVTV
jgi:two-component system, NarL family, nitrate/nitrite response regulator NarL